MNLVLILLHQLQGAGSLNHGRYLLICSSYYYMDDYMDDYMDFWAIESL